MATERPKLVALMRHQIGLIQPLPRDLCQKLAVVSKDLIVGWAGEYKVAREVISDLIQLNTAQRFTNASLQQHFDSLGASV